MAAVAGKFVANKLLSKQMDKYKDKKVESGDDPFFATIDDPKRPGKQKKVKKAIPPYIPEPDALVLAKVRKSAYRLDMCLFTFLGIRFGWSSVIGIVPAVGDVVGMLLALMVFRKCCQIEGGLDGGTKLKMLFFIAFDFGIGLIPFVGDLADAAYKCNTKNARELERVLDKRYRPEGYDSERVGKNDEGRKKRRQSGIYAPNDPPPATMFEDFSDEESDRRRPVNDDRTETDYSPVRRPAGTRAPDDRRGGTRPSRQNSRRQQNGSVRR